MEVAAASLVVLDAHNGSNLLLRSIVEEAALALHAEEERPDLIGTCCTQELQGVVEEQLEVGVLLDVARLEHGAEALLGLELNARPNLVDANVLLALLGRDEEGKLLQSEALWVLFLQHLFGRGPLNQLPISGPLVVVRRRSCQLPYAADSHLHLVRPCLGLCDARIQEEVFVIDSRFSLLDLFLCLLLQQIRLVNSLLRYFHPLTLRPDSPQLFVLPRQG